nr:transmembrane protein 64-like [Ipomoea batatas]
MWVAGMSFGYGYGFLLIIGGAAIGVSLPYFIGYLFRRRVQVFIERYPKNASMIRLAGEGDCLNQFQAVALIRISPFPYIVYNYCAMATGVKYFPYLLGSLWHPDKDAGKCFPRPTLPISSTDHLHSLRVLSHRGHHSTNNSIRKKAAQATAGRR